MPSTQKLDSVLLDKRIGQDGSTWCHTCLVNGFLNLYTNCSLETSEEKTESPNTVYKICLYIGYRDNPLYFSVSSFTNGKLVSNFPVYENEEVWAQVSVENKIQLYGFVSQKPC
tara:strand:- start:124 stop:465 length:342 start_codon:yes stop_codon:yes gene_type:complete